MELDNLKQAWNKQDRKDVTIPVNNMMELIHYKSKAPLAELKRRIRIQLLFAPVVVVIFTGRLITSPELMHDMMIWFFIIVFLALTGYFWFNYRIINRLQKTGPAVKEVIEKDIHTLENGIRKFFIIKNIILIFLAILLEVLMHFHQIPYMEEWYANSIFIRIGLYICLIIFAILVGKYSFNKQFGQHIAFLKELLQKAN
jgi:hypothetical protein